MSFVSHRRSRSSLIRGDAKIWNSMGQCPEAVQPRQIQALNMLHLASVQGKCTGKISEPGDFRTESEITVRPAPAADYRDNAFTDGHRPIGFSVRPNNMGLSENVVYSQL